MIDMTVDQLTSLSASKEPIDALKKDLDPVTGQLKLISAGVEPVEGNNEDEGIMDDERLRSQLQKATGNGIVLTNVVEADLKRMMDT